MYIWDIYFFVLRKVIVFGKNMIVIGVLIFCILFIIIYFIKMLVIMLDNGIF